MLTKPDVAKKLAEKADISMKAAKEYVNDILEIIQDSVAEGEDVNFIGFGKFELREKAAHEGINPMTKEKINIPAKKTVAFKAGASWKEKLNG